MPLHISSGSSAENRFTRTSPRATSPARCNLLNQSQLLSLVVIIPARERLLPFAHLRTNISELWRIGHPPELHPSYCRRLQCTSMRSIRVSSRACGYRQTTTTNQVEIPSCKQLKPKDGQRSAGRMQALQGEAYARAYGQKCMEDGFSQYRQTLIEYLKRLRIPINTEQSKEEDSPTPLLTI